MATFESWEGLCHAAQIKCGHVLEKDVAPVTTEILRRHIQTDIYGKYTPKNNGWVNNQTYQRRHVLEGSLYTLITGLGEITITSRAPANKSIIPGWNFTVSEPGDFLKFIELGRTGIWKGGFPRPAVSNAQKEVNKSSEIKNAIKLGLQREFGFSG